MFRVYVPCRAPKPSPHGFLYRCLRGLTKCFNGMTINGVLRSAQAQEMALACPVGENNWKSRMCFCSTLAQAIEDFATPGVLEGTIDQYLNNIIDAAVCERTTLSIAACRLLGLLPRAINVVPYIDRIVSALVRQTASTKAVAQKSSSAAIENIILWSPYNVRTLYHVCQAFENKYSAPKLYAPGWLKLIIDNYYPALHPDRDYDHITRAISIGLEEADNNVRVKTRAVFWAWQKVDPASAENIMSKLNPHAKTALINDPNNPDKGSKPPSKKQPDSVPALTQVKQQAKERLKQKAPERSRVTSTKTSVGDEPVKLADEDKSEHHSRVHHHPVSASDPTSVMNRTASRPVSIPGHKKGSSYDGQVPLITKKTSVLDIGAAVPKKTGSTDSLRASQNKKHTSTAAAESSTARPLLSAPVRRPRIVATPINAAQSSSRPGSRTGHLQVTTASSEPALRSAVSHRELKSSSGLHPSTENQDTTRSSKKIPRSDLSSPVLIPDGKENASIYNITKKVDTSPERLTTRHPDPGPTHSPKSIKIEPDGLSRSQRLHRQELDSEIAAMVPQMPSLIPLMEKQDENNHNQMTHVYLDMNHDGTIGQARRALENALQYLSKDALDAMGFRKLRKLLETYGNNLIVDQSLYDTLFTELLHRLGTFEELLAQPLHEVQHESHPRYIRQAVLNMVCILVTDFPVEWSHKFQGSALASMMLARCSYSANCEYHEGAPYLSKMTIVEQINASIQIMINACLEPLTIMDAVLSVLAACEDFLVRNAPHDSESQGSWASFNPYSKINRLRLEGAGGIFNPLPTNLDTFEVVDPQPLPMKLPLLMETGLRITKTLLIKVELEKWPLGEDREDLLADLCRHLLQTYNIIIRRQVVDFIHVLYRNIESEERFWTHFPNDSERNLLHYYLERMDRQMEY